MCRLTNRQSKRRFQQRWSQYDTNVSAGFSSCRPSPTYGLFVLLFMLCSHSKVECFCHTSVRNKQCPSRVHDGKSHERKEEASRLDSTHHISVGPGAENKHPLHTKTSPSIIFRRDKSDTNPAHRPKLSLLCSRLPATLPCTPSVCAHPFFSRMGMGG